jgi:2-polyprenyl-6-methoxyphenol hydroxylase-like FAD-dependent oxidoreductase
MGSLRVAINGIGVGGPTLAYWLRQYGHDPVLFEKAPALRSEGYLIDFWGLGYDIAERMGLLPKLHETCYLMKRLRMVDASGHDDAKLDLAPMREVLRERFFSLARADLARALVEACGDVPAHFGVSLTAIDQDHDGVLATLSNGRQERFDLVVGADGLHSRVRELVFGAEARYERSMGCYVAAFRIPGYPHRDELSYVSHTVPKRHVARVTLRNDETLALLVCRAEVIDGSFPKMSPKEALRRSFGGMRWEVPEILDAMDRAADFYFDRVSQIQLPRWYSGRVGLLGDAAACASLLAGEGTGLAMLEAYVLAGELHRADGDFARAFESYDARLRSFVTAKQKAALGFRGFFAPQTVLGLKARNALVSALSIGFFAKRILAGQLRDDFELPEYSGTPGAALSGLAPPGAASGA